jgi:hypothetical protein
MSFSRPIQWYHSHADPIWPDGTLRYSLEDYFRTSQAANGRAGGSVGQEELLLC